VIDQPPHPPPRPGARHPRRPLPAARRALTVLAALLLSLAAMTPAASATPPPPEPAPGPPPPPPTVTAPGLPLWAVLVILGGSIALSAATTLITLALHPTATHGPGRRPAPQPERCTSPYRQPGPPPATCQRSHPGQGQPVRDGTPRAPGPGTGTGPRPPAPADPFAARPIPPQPSAARTRGQLPLIPPHRRSS
jgi:hypothetical protein